MNSTNEITEYLKRLKNDEKCLEEFFRAASGYIKFVAYYYLIDKSFLDDVVNNAFYDIFRSIKSFDERQSGKAWISKITQNEAYAINLRESKHVHVSLDEISEEVACIADDSSRLEFVAALEKSLSELDDTERKIVEMRIIEDLTFVEIAKRLNMYVGTVFKKFQRCVKEITKEIM